MSREFLLCTYFRDRTRDSKGCLDRFGPSIILSAVAQSIARTWGGTTIDFASLSTEFSVDHFVEKSWLQGYRGCRHPSATNSYHREVASMRDVSPSAPHTFHLLATELSRRLVVNMRHPKPSFSVDAMCYGINLTIRLVLVSRRRGLSHHKRKPWICRRGESQLSRLLPGTSPPSPMSCCIQSCLLEY